MAFFVALINRCRQIFVCLIFVGRGTHENFSPTKISLPRKFFHLRYDRVVCDTQLPSITILGIFLPSCMYCFQCQLVLFDNVQDCRGLQVDVLAWIPCMLMLWNTLFTKCKTINQCKHVIVIIMYITWCTVLFNSGFGVASSLILQRWRKKWVYNCCGIKQSGRKALHVFEQRDIGWLECYTSMEIICIEISCYITNKLQCIAFLTGSEVTHRSSTPAADNAKCPRLVHWRVPVTSTRVIFFTLASSWEKLTTVIPLHIKHIPAATLV